MEIFMSVLILIVIYFLIFGLVLRKISANFRSLELRVMSQIVYFGSILFSVIIGIALIIIEAIGV